MSQRILVLSPHPDDDAIGCGGTLCQHIASGDQVKLIVLTSGEAGGHGLDAPIQTARLREVETQAASRVIGIEDVEFWRQPDGQLAVTEELLARLAWTLTSFDPQTIYAPHPAEMHPDHRAAAALLRAVLSAMTGRERKTRLYEVWTPIQEMDEIVDISEYIETKREAIQQHQTQIRAMRLDEAAIALNRYRGEMHSWPGGDYAEVFQWMRI